LVPVQASQQPLARRYQLRQTRLHASVKPGFDLLKERVDDLIAVLGAEFPMGLGRRTEIVRRQGRRTHGGRITPIVSGRTGHTPTVPVPNCIDCTMAFWSRG